MPFTRESALRWLWIFGSNEAAVSTFTGHPVLTFPVVMSIALAIWLVTPEPLPTMPAT